MNILFTGYNFDGYHGSMMLITEIGRYLKEQGHDIYVASLNLTPKIKKEVKQIGLKIFSVEDLPKDIEYDIIWAYHFPLLTYLIDKKIKYKKIISGCLSGLLIPLEIPNFLCYQVEIPILVNSEETKARLIEKFPSLKNQFKVLPNLVPDEFFEYEKNSHVEKPREIAIVSNHVPKELLITKKMLEKQNIKVDIYGNGGTKQNIKIEPQILINYDAIITIGKTVQYALALGIPVYNYDYMGGSGYINLKNIDTEEFYNFSGRSFERKLTPVELVEEILTGYKANLQDVKALQAIARERYLLSKNINKVIQDIDCSPNTIIEQSEQWILYSTQISCLIDEIIMYRNRANSIKQKIFRVVVKHYKNTLQKVKNFL